MPPRFERFWHVFGPEAFEWDERKNDANYEKHGLDLAAASAVFRGEILRRRDSRHKKDHVYQALGEAFGIVLMVAYTVRKGRCRIISARKADTYETRLYHER
jgi:uncharacterized protein